MAELERKVALVTGSGRGIGRHIILGFAREGAKSVVADIDLTRAIKTAEEIEQMGKEVLTIKVDVTKAVEVKEMVERIRGRFGQIDILVNNAGIFPQSLVVEMKEEEWDQVLDINLKGAFLCSREVAKIMIKQRRGKIVNILSSRAIKGGVGTAHYSASKAGLLAFTKSLALELAPYEINVNAVTPSVTNTEMPRTIYSQEELEKMARQNPLGRIGEPEDVFNAVMFLVSEASKTITGQNILVNGGSLMP